MKLLQHFRSCDKSNFFVSFFFIIFFFIFIKISRESSANYYRDNKERLQKKAREKYQRLPKEEKEKIANMFVNDIKISQKTKILQNEKNLFSSDEREGSFL